MIRLAVLLCILIAVGAGALSAGRLLADKVSGGLAADARAALAAEAVAEPHVRTDGLLLDIAGVAADGDARARVLDGLDERWPGVLLIDRIGIAASAVATRDVWRLRLTRQGSSVRLVTAGLSEDAADLFRRRLQDALSEMDVTVVATSPPLGAQADDTITDAMRALDVAARAAEALPQAVLSARPDEIEIRGLVPEGADPAQVEQTIRQSADRAQTLRFDLITPAPVIVPYRFTVRNIPEAGLVVEDCAVPDAETDAAVRARVADAVCEIGQGSPGPGWKAAIEAGLAAVDALPGATFDLIYHLGTLHIPATIPDATAESTANAARVSMPEGYGLQTLSGFATDGVAPDEPVPPSPGWLRIVVADDVITLAGIVGGTAGQVALETAAAAAFGAEAVRSTLSPRDGAMPDGWGRGGQTAVAVLAAAGTGSVEMAGDRFVVDVTVPDQRAAAETHLALDRVPETMTISSRVRVDLPGTVARIPMPGPRCAAALNRVVAETPIRFAPSSAAPTPDDADVIARLVAVMEGCSDDRLMVEGHTDSQGSENYNLRLSQARAEAVADALVDAGVPVTGLLAAGFGEARPIADNATEDGRMQNRRIAFSLGDDAP